MTQNFWVRRNFWEVPRRVMKVSSEFQILKLKRITWLVDNRREAFLFMNVCLSCILSRLMNALSLAPSWRRRELWICMWDLHVCLVSSILRRILKIRIQIRILNPWIKTFDISIKLTTWSACPNCMEFVGLQNASTLYTVDRRRSHDVHMNVAHAVRMFRMFGLFGMIWPNGWLNCSRMHEFTFWMSPQNVHHYTEETWGWN